MKKYRTPVLILLIVLLQSTVIAQGNYKLIIKTKPNFVKVNIDSVYYGSTPIVVDQLKKGKHVILLSLKNYKDMVFTVELDSAVTQINRTLNRLYSQVSFQLKPGSAKIQLDGKRIQKSSSSLEIPFGRHTLFFDRDAYYSQKIRLNIHKPFLDMGNIHLKPKSRTTAFWLSTVLPGLGQVYSDRTISGMGIFLASMAGLAYSFHPQLGYNKAKYNYLLSKERYEKNSKLNYLLYKRLKDEMFNTYYDMRREYYRRNTILIVTAVIWLYNLWDVYYLFPKQDVILSDSGLRLTLKFNF